MKPSGKKSILLAVLMLAAALLLTSCVNPPASGGKSGARAPSASDHNTVSDFSELPAAEDGSAAFTLFVYMIGSDLESYDGAASRDWKKCWRLSPGIKSGSR